MDGVIESITRTLELLQSKVKSREQALAVTKLEECLFWYKLSLEKKK